ncbi:phage protein NinX family protein [Serratia proteamaculans]|uniref:phage protein NinX family protein n=1 Tax=Serratia proteamaculans TaxID=28151 RepID=UPI001020F67C|nr:phage protein NinX family protein [Serratia proteamaculans]RYM55633.1 hypothetical protein BSQ96_02705 [Serratia proteamaculans]
MTDYSRMSDFEINKAVAIMAGHHCYYGDGGYTNDGVNVTVKGNGIIGWFNPCNNPADAWPIILENKITIFWGGGIPVAKTIDGYLGRTPICNNVHVDRNPLRAAMIVFLMMKETEQCSS